MNLKFIPVILFLFAIVLMSFISEKPAGKKKVVFFGDSITEMGVQPNGYISVMERMLQQQQISNYELVGAGIGGNKVYDLYLRMPEDVLAKMPDIVLIYVGVNDIWHKQLFGTGTDKDKFERFYRAIISELQNNGAKVIVCTPATIGEKKDCTNEMDGDLNAYSNIIRSISADFKLSLVDLRSAFLDYENKHNQQNLTKGILTTDGVHLNDQGNKLVARLMWEKIREIN